MRAYSKGVIIGHKKTTFVTPIRRPGNRLTSASVHDMKAACGPP